MLFRSFWAKFGNDGGLWVVVRRKERVGEVGCFLKCEVNEEKSEKLRVFNPNLAFMPRHNVGMPRH